VDARSIEEAGRELGLRRWEECADAALAFVAGALAVVLGSRAALALAIAAFALALVAAARRYLLVERLALDRDAYVIGAVRRYGLPPHEPADAGAAVAVAAEPGRRAVAVRVLHRPRPRGGVRGRPRAARPRARGRRVRGGAGERRRLSAPAQRWRREPAPQPGRSGRGPAGGAAADPVRHPPRCITRPCGRFDRLRMLARQSPRLKQRRARDREAEREAQEQGLFPELAFRGQRDEYGRRQPTKRGEVPAPWRGLWHAVEGGRRSFPRAHGRAV